MTTRMRDGSEVDDRRLGRLVSFDERSREYPVARLLGAIQGPSGATALTAPPRSYTWACDVVLDQGREGACVGFAWAHEAAARPDRRFVTQSDALSVYRRAQTLDAFPGESYEGTSVIAGAKVAKERTWLVEYRWAFTVEDICRTLAYLGPVVLGIVWYQSDYTPNGEHFITGEGAVAGGHCILALGVKIVWKAGTGRTWADVDQDKSYVILHNSWSARYGLHGRCRMTITQLQHRMSEQGEACVPVVRRAATLLTRTLPA